jgi:DUF4097 and DUF4098 domain-containing protein YvlB
MRYGTKMLVYAVLVLGAANGFAGGASTNLVNTRIVEPEGIAEISIYYDSGSVVFLENGEDRFLFKEYMQVDRDDYYASVEVSNGTLVVKNSDYPWFRNLRKKLEVYLPRSFTGSYRVSLGSGSLKAETGITSSGTVDISLSSGSVQLEKVRAAGITLRSSSGSIKTAGLYGNTDIHLSSGSLSVAELEGEKHQMRLLSGSVEIVSVSGEASFSSSSGSIKLGVSRLTGDLSFDIKSGSLDLFLPRDTPFNLDAETSSGGIKIRSPGYSFTVKNRSSVLRSFGDNPEYTITAVVRSGGITITQGLSP